MGIWGWQQLCWHDVACSNGWEEGSSKEGSNAVRGGIAILVGTSRHDDWRHDEDVRFVKLGSHARKMLGSIGSGASLSKDPMQRAYDKATNHKDCSQGFLMNVSERVLRSRRRFIWGLCSRLES